jgi:hypothetical protein
MAMSAVDDFERAEMPANKPFQMRATDEFWREVDAWRRLQPDIPNRAEAIRRLVVIGLRADPPTQRLTPANKRPEPKK